MCSNWHLVIGFTLEFATSFLFVYTAPLFEKERNMCSKALVADVKDPFEAYRSCAGAGFATNYNPINAFEVKVRNWSQKGFERNEFYRSVSSFQVADAEDVACIFYGDAHPHVLRPRQTGA